MLAVVTVEAVVAAVAFAPPELQLAAAAVAVAVESAVEPVSVVDNTLRNLP